MHGVQLNLPFVLGQIDSFSLFTFLIGLFLLLPLVLIRVIRGRNLQSFLDNQVIILIVVLFLLVESCQLLEDGVKHLYIHDDLGKADRFDPFLEPCLKVRQSAVEQFVEGGVTFDVIQ